MLPTVIENLLRKRDIQNFTLVEFHGRPVFIRPLKDYEKDKYCADCKCKATMAVYELNSSYWYYCGGCDIG